MTTERIDHRFVDRDGAPVYDLSDYPSLPFRVTGTVVEYERLEGHIVFTHTVEAGPAPTTTDDGARLREMWALCEAAWPLADLTERDHRRKDLIARITNGRTRSSGDLSTDEWDEMTCALAAEADLWSGTP